MIELFSLYKLAFFLCLVAGVGLSVQGAYLIARNEGLQILALAQAALAGNLVGKLVVSGEGREASSLLFSLLSFVLVKLAFRNYREAREAFFIVIYIAFLALSYLLISVFPGLESHMAVGFFGDIVSLSQTGTLVLIGIFMVLVGILIHQRKNILRVTFEKSVLGINDGPWGQELLFGAVFVFSLYGLGLLFSVAAMIFPAVIIGARGRNLKSSLFLMGATSALAATGGLALSIYTSKLSTVPTQVLLLLILLIVTYSLLNLCGEKYYES